MDRRDMRLLEELLDNSRTPPYRARVWNPRNQVISAAYIKDHTIEPLHRKEIGELVYTVSIRKEFAGPDGREVGLVVLLYERSLLTGYGSRVSVVFTLPNKEDTYFVNKAAELLGEAYKKSRLTANSKIQYMEMLRQLIAGRIEYYMRGGSAQNNRN
jgi:hypothetical protein